MMSKPQVKPRSCSIFCCASTDAFVVIRALWFDLVEMRKSCASEASATVMMVVATSVSISEKPPSLLKLDFAKCVHRDVSRLAFSAHRDRGARRGQGRPGVANACIHMDAAVGPELQRGKRRERRLRLEPSERAVVVRTS